MNITLASVSSEVEGQDDSESVELSDAELSGVVGGYFVEPGLIDIPK